MLFYELGELIGYFMGDGSLHAKGIRLCVADSDLDVVARLSVLVRDLACYYESAVTGNPALLPALPVQYSDFVVWQRRWMQPKPTP